MKSICYYVAAVAILFATSGCQKDSEDTLSVGDKKIEFKTSIVNENPISGNIKKPVMNDDGSGNFSNGDVFTLYVLSESGKSTNIKYSVGITNLYWKDINLNSEDHQVHFSACYPEQELSDGKFSFDMETAPVKDLLWAHNKGVSTETSEPVELQFKHIMHRLVINYSTESDIEVDQIKTVCTAKSTCEIDLAGETIDHSNALKADFPATGKQISFMLVPQKVSDVKLHVVVGKLEKDFNLNEYVKLDNLESGMQLTVNLKVKDGSIVLEGNSIDPWGDQGTIEGEIIM